MLWRKQTYCINGLDGPATVLDSVSSLNLNLRRRNKNKKKKLWLEKNKLGEMCAWRVHLIEFGV